MTPPVVLDTNIVLDCWVFEDPATAPLRCALHGGNLRWLATLPMRTELARVLGYPQIAPRLAYHGRTAAAVLERFDTLAQLCDVPPKAAPTCKDPDDQGFVDLAVAHRARLFSKDHAVLCMKKRLLALGVLVSIAIDLEAHC